MATIKRFAIGDVQGCCSDLDRLLALTRSDDPNHEYWFTGDLVNRGPASAQTIRSIMAMGSRAKTVLGNHDLHLLAMAAGIRKPGKKDTAAHLLDASDSSVLIDWLRNQPLLYLDEQFALCHAGIYPGWTANDAKRYADEISTALRGDNWQDALRAMYGNTPAAWSEQLAGAQRLRFIVNSFTRMRFLNHDSSLDLVSKESSVGEDRATGLTPWFEWPRKKLEQTIIFGHWSSQGLVNRDQHIGLDTGCVWGGQLTAMNIDTRELLSVQCQPHQAIGA